MLGRKKKKGTQKRWYPKKYPLIKDIKQISVGVLK